MKIWWVEIKSSTLSIYLPSSTENGIESRMSQHALVQRAGLLYVAIKSTQQNIYGSQN